MRSTTAIAALLLLLASAAAVDACTSQTAVNLGAAGDYAVLAGASVTTGTGTASRIVGKVGVFPGGAAPMAGMALTDNTAPTNPNTALFCSPAILPRLCCATADCDNLNKTEAMAVTKLAVDALLAAINDAKSRTTTCVTAPPNALPQEIGGMTYYPGLYTRATDVQITAEDLTLSGDGVFIFQIGTAFKIAGKKIILADGAKAENIFWQVGSSATIEAQSHVEGNVLASVSVTVALGATVNGRVLAHTAAVTLMQNVIIKP